MLIGCAAAPPPPASAPAEAARAVAPVEVAAAVEVTSAAAGPAPAPEVAAEVTTPEVKPPLGTCEIRRGYWDSQVARTLRSASGRAYGTIVRADELRFVVEGGARAEFTALGVRLQTSPRASDLPLFTTRDDLVFAGVMRAGKAMPLVWATSEGPRLRVAPPRDRRVRFVGAPEVEVACETLTLQRGFGDTVNPEHRLRPRGPVAVAATPGGPAALHLHLTRAVAVEKLEQSGAQVKIAWPIEDGPLVEAIVSGWVDGRLIAALRDPQVGSFAASGLSLVGSSHWSGCGAEYPLFVAAGGAPEAVGVILRGTRVRAKGRRGEYVAVEVEGQAVRESPPPFTLRKGASFLLTAAAAADCGR
ncbi:MAG: hypothetical protein JNL82_40930 [Myxococcales bacterium]|nr:hypothetical protein [Myxococcales bacterium]